MTTQKRHILFAASECAPLCKTGGLADVVGALPRALTHQNIKTSIILPFYKTLPKDIRENSIDIDKFTINMGWRKQYVGLKKYSEINRTYYFIDNETYFLRDNLYGYFDDSERFIYFAMAIIASLKYMPDIDIIHCNDWQTALIPTLLKKFHYENQKLNKIRTVYTIHNMRFQGNLNLEDFVSFLGITMSEPWLGEAYHDGQANLLKSALYSSDHVTTVSPNYANEIKYEYYGESLHNIIHDIDFKLSGILNGIDIDTFNPRNDKDIYWDFNGVTGKQKNKERFLYDYRLPNDNQMLIGMVTRLDRQKGLDLLLYGIDQVMQMPVQFVMLGTGDSKYEAAFHDIEKKYPDRARCFIMYDESLAHKIYASSDVFVMPSKFEPCGLGQMIAMRYGTLPIVRETGGLADTVIPYNAITDEGTGFSFRNYNGDELIQAIQMANNLYINNRPAFNNLATAAMAQEFSWEVSAQKYIDLYETLINQDMQQAEEDAKAHQTENKNTVHPSVAKAEMQKQQEPPSKTVDVSSDSPNNLSEDVIPKTTKTVKPTTAEKAFKLTNEAKKPEISDAEPHITLTSKTSDEPEFEEKKVSPKKSATFID